MSCKVHIFADDPWWEAAVERYLVYCLGRAAQVVGYQFTELEVCDRETFGFDAAVAGAYGRGTGCDDLAPFGVELFLGFPGKVVLLSPLWLLPPPNHWRLCLEQPLDRPEHLADAVRLALAGPPTDGPDVAELRRYLPFVPLAGSGHGVRRARDHE